MSDDNQLSTDYHLKDRLTSMLALTHAIQNCLLQAGLKNNISVEMCQKIENYAAALSDYARKLGGK